MKIMDVCQVTPASESATEFSLPLTFFDIIWLKFPPVERIFFYKLTGLSPSFFNSAVLPDLKRSLSHALLHFLPLAGNLTWPPQATKPIILYTPNDGVELTVGESNADFHHLSCNGVREALESRSDPNPRSLKLLPALAVLSSPVRATFELSGEDIKKLRTRVSAQLVKEDSQQAKPAHLSNFVLVFAHASVCIVKSKGLESDRTVLMAFAADCRARLEPPIHDNYLGNCVTSCDWHTEAGSLLEESGYLCAVERLSEFIRGLEKGVLDGSKKKLARYMMTIEAACSFMIGVAGSTRFQVYGTDFGWGKPEKVEITSVDRTGAISIAESRDGNGGVEIGLVLEKYEMEKFTSLFVDGLKNH
ncbi:hypothetical protein SADUNF_Sadunf17G0091900 [Salix dunnii]|uniref:Uncharacterized protein n=1 Tax=Salix dunnii TaxID=1413687 RepID=A0A835J694_9ROSI|nr:hypothetical protein SADUNF_Sadunf17G0091900 [Salix dunnii]